MQGGGVLSALQQTAVDGDDDGLRGTGRQCTRFLAESGYPVRSFGDFPFNALRPVVEDVERTRHIGSLVPEIQRINVVVAVIHHS